MISADRMGFRGYSLSSESDGTLMRETSRGDNRDYHVRLLMRKRADQFTSYQDLRLFCGTWNVNGKTASEDLLPWFKSCTDQPPGIIALGFQELDLSKEAYLFAGSAREAEWKTAALLAVNKISPTTNYQMVKLTRLVGIMLILFISDDILPHVNNITVSHVATGIMGLLGNKGGVGIRLEVHSTSICFISSHLAAHTEEYERRNQDYRDISKIQFTVLGFDPINLKQHDMIFWLGDLNYRISGMTNFEVKTLISKNELDRLLINDQLNQQKSAEKVFDKYSEPEIKFTPTYKYNVGTNDFDSSEKARCPSWTDRILYRGSGIAPVTYTSAPQLLLSDHKPVSCTYDVKLKVINKESYRSVYEDVMKELDRLENEYLPQVAVSPLELKFGLIEFMEPVIKIITIKNTGQVPADFSFIPKLDESEYCKPWLTVKPSMDCILPGDSYDIEMTLYVEKNTAHKLNTGEDSLVDILVLHLDGGKDFFISLSAEYKLSCFGSNLETLVKIPQPITELTREQIIDFECNTTEVENSNRCPIPKELWYICDSIHNKGRFEEDLFQQRGLHREVVQIIHHLDTTLSEELPGTIHSIAEALLVFLESLGEPVIPYSKYDDAMSAAHSQIKSIEVVSSLPLVHKRVFEYLTEFMRELLKYQASNNLDVHILANVFAPIIIKSKIESSKSEKRFIVSRKAEFLRHFL